MKDYTRAIELSPEMNEAISDAFSYHPWTTEQKSKSDLVRAALADATRVIVANVPPGPDRSSALRKLREACMDCNASITFNGRL